MRPGDLEGGKTPPYRRRRKKTFWRMPISVILSTLLIFVFFLVLGIRRSGDSGLANAAAKKTNIGQPTLYTYEVINEYPHDTRAFTQGLEYDERCTEGGPCRPVFWESTGLRGRSTVREVEMTTGKILRSRDLPNSHFGEGVTKLGDRLYQVTWQTNRGWSYNVDNFNDAKEFKTPLSDGWGATSNGTHLIVGDSSDMLYFINPATMKTEYEVQVQDGGVPVRWLNELEWVDGIIYANVYQTECIAQIDPATGNVVGWMFLEGLRDRMLRSMSNEQGQERPDVLNGVAWDGRNSRLFVTGKLWNKIYQIESRPMYVDSKAVDVPQITQRVREACIIPEERTLGL